MSQTGEISFEDLREIASQGSCAAMVADLTASLAYGDDESAALVVDLLREVDGIPDDQAEKLVPLANSDSPPVAAWACKLLSRSSLGSAAEEAICRTLSTHTNTGAKQEAAKALGDLESISPQTRDALKVAAASDDPRLSRMSQRALSSHGEA